MDRIVTHFRRMHQIEVAPKTAERLANTVRAMRSLDGGLRLGVMGADIPSLAPRRADVTLADLRAILEGRREVA